MTGTGTQADPFVVDNWSDFVTAVGTSGAYVTFPDTPGVINMNDEAPTGLTSTVTLKCAGVDGKGWQIRNLYSVGGHTVFYNSANLVVSNLDFINMYIDFQSANGYFFWRQNTNNCQITFNGCVFSGMMITIPIIGYNRQNWMFNTENYHSKTQLNSCAITIQLQGDSMFWSESETDTANIFSFTTVKLSGDSAKNLNGCYKNCKFTGASKSTNLYIKTDSRSTYNVFDVDFSQAASFSCAAPTGSINLINTDKLPAGATIGTGFIGVTTEQLSDATYLISLGFPIAEE